MSGGGVFKAIKYTTGLNTLKYTTDTTAITCARNKHICLGVETRFCSTIASAKALDHANTPRRMLCPYEVRAANTQR